VKNMMNLLGIMKDGEYISYYISGDVEYKCFYLDGKRHGESIKYFSSGDISYTMNYIDDNLHGESIIYYKVSEIFYKYYYIYDKVVTELGWISYDRNIKFELLGL